ncbi:lytic murein transglycosylase [Streptomyces collinus]|uniref:Membrane-bound lytic murein transglycosylase B n=2 Tax=Streptomyces collinus TaxID=42684 RepID=A0AA89TW50_STRCU|nr:lytic murein transglycosylase [Streptomyces collinus]MBB5810673.1 membrane-bound lytic murein transglycosylase B [Streptomyces collinus]WMX63950.1 lytic murein transglycosylase [Streptomyces collinus]
MAGHRGRRVRGTAAAVVAMAALTASQAPGVIPARASAPAPRQAPADDGPSVSGDAPYRTELPPLRTGKRAGGGGAVVEVGGALPASVFAAYRRAEDRLAREAPGCRLRWQLLAAIGQVESGQARGGRVTSDGTTVAPILGPRLDGVAFALIRDTDGGVHDGDKAYDRAVGPMQFIPSTWARWGADGNGDGRTDPNNVFDAALAAGRYLCAGGRDLSVPAELDRAILGYNHSTAYLRTVRAWYTYFMEGHRVVPDGSAGSSSAHPEPSRPAATPKPSRTPSARPSAPPSRTPSTPASPTPAATGPATEPAKPDEPQLPVTDPDMELPGENLLPSGAPLTSNSADSMTVSPSTTADTGR